MPLGTSEQDQAKQTLREAASDLRALADSAEAIADGVGPVLTRGQALAIDELERAVGRVLLRSSRNVTAAAHTIRNTAKVAL